MRQFLVRIQAFLAVFGLDPLKGVRSLRDLPWYFQTLRRYRQLVRDSGPAEFPLGALRPCIGERSSGSGVAGGHYFHQDLLVARRVHQNSPRLHVDVGSRVDGFIAHVAAFRAIEVFDIRPLTSDIPNVTFRQADMMHSLDPRFLGYCDSLSCLHALEHFGLGRYGDPVNPSGDTQGIENLAFLLAQGGKLYLSVPIGPQRVEFNAHRVYSVQRLLERLAGRFKLDRFAYVDDRGDLHDDVALTEEGARTSYGCTYGCGIFEMTRL